jgi:hypothetical protein
LKYSFDTVFYAFVCQEVDALEPVIQSLVCHTNLSRGFARAELMLDTSVETADAGLMCQHEKEIVRVGSKAERKQR